jgi:hypothetical protein
MTAITFESVLTQAQQLAPNERARLIGVLAQALAQPAASTPQPLSAEERRARVEAVRGKYAHLNTSVDEFLARKHEDTEREEARYLARHPEEAKEAQ